MTLDSKYFDAIRAKPGKRRSKGKDANVPTCQWVGCARPGTHKAPLKGEPGAPPEGVAGEQGTGYARFCIEHVRSYNRSYNYFAGMSADDIAAFQEGAATGNRPVWPLRRGAGGTARLRAARFGVPTFDNPLGLEDVAPELSESSNGQPRARPRERPRHLRRLERRSLRALDLDAEAKGEAIRHRYKELVKRLHPDANGGDRSNEDRLRDIIQAYSYLRSAGLC